MFQALSMRGHEPPKTDVLEWYHLFREWWDAYLKDPEIGANPYRQYGHGFSTRG